MSEAHRDELEALSAFLIKPHELAVLPCSRASAPPSLLAQPELKTGAIRIDEPGNTLLKLRVTPSDAKDDDGDDEASEPAFYLWLHVLWPASYPAGAGAGASASTSARPVLDLDAEHNRDYLPESARRGLVKAMTDEVKSMLNEPVTLTMLTVLRDQLAKIPPGDRVKKSLFDTISTHKPAAAATGTAAATDAKDVKGAASSGSGPSSASSSGASGSSGSSSSAVGAPATASMGAATAAPAITQVKVELTKKQKRRMGKHLDEKGEKKRGWNWVDLVSHLSKSGDKT